MVGQCIMCYGGVLYVRAVYCMLWRCTICYGCVPCGRLVYCVLWWPPAIKSKIEHSVIVRPLRDVARSSHNIVGWSCDDFNLYCEMTFCNVV